MEKDYKYNLPKYLQERCDSLIRKDGLIDNCKYMLYFDTKWNYNNYICIPVRNIKEAIEFLQEAKREVN